MKFIPDKFICYKDVRWYLSLERIIIETRLVRILVLLFSFCNLHHPYDFFSVSWGLEFVFEGALKFLRLVVDPEDLSSGNVNITTVFLTDVLYVFWWNVEFVNKCVASLVHQSMLADFIWKLSQTKIVDFPDETSFGEYCICTSLQCANELGLKKYGIA